MSNGMNEILHANIFFIIASLATVCFTVLVCFILYQVYRIVASIRRIMDRVEHGSQVVADDIQNLRNSFNPMNIVTFVMNMMPGMHAPPQPKDDDK